MRVLVIGAGISGLATAVALKEKNIDFLVIEKKERAGGVIGSFRQDGFLAESGSNTIMVINKQVEDILKSYGAKTIKANAAAKKRYFSRNSKSLAMPSNPIGLLTTPLFSFGGKIRAIGDLFVKKFPNNSEPSVQEFITKRLGKDIYNYAINPFMGGIYAGDPSKLSIKHAFAPLWNVEQKYGSIIGGFIKSMKDKKKALKQNGEKTSSFKPSMVSFKNGMQELVELMQDKISDNLVLGANIIKIENSQGKYELSFETSQGEKRETFDKIISCVQTKSLLDLPISNELKEELNFLSEIRYAPMVSLTMSFKRQDISHPLDGFGMLIPEKEKCSLTGVLFTSSLFENRAKDDCVTLTCYVGGMRSPELYEKTQEQIKQMVIKDLEKLLGLKSTKPIFEKIFYWKNAIAQYEIGYGKIVEKVKAFEEKNPSFILSSNYLNGVGVGNCLMSASANIEKILQK